MNEINQPSNIAVGLLVDADCAKALGPIRVIPSQRAGPYAFRIILGWSIVGPVQERKRNKTNLSCCEVSVYEAETNRTAHDHFAIEILVKGIGVERMLQL